MTNKELLAALRRNMVETGSLMCMGCGYGHHCSINGCAIMWTAADRIEALTAQLAESERERAVAVSDLTRCGTCDGSLCEYCKQDGVCEIGEEEFGKKWPGCFQWRGLQEAGEGGG